MTELQAAQTLRDAATRLIANLDAISTFRNLPGNLQPSPIYERERKRSLREIKEVLSVLLPNSRGTKTKRNTSPEVKAWKSAHMKLVLAKNKAKRGGDATEIKKAEVAYKAWRDANPSPKKATASSRK